MLDSRMKAVVAGIPSNWGSRQRLQSTQYLRDLGDCQIMNAECQIDEELQRW